MTIIFRTAAAAALLLSATAASAVNYTFTVTSQNPDPSDGFPNYAFQIDLAAKMPASVTGGSFTINDVITYGTRPVFGPFSYGADYTFYTASTPGGIDAGFGDGAGHDYLSEQLFTGSTAMPTFRTGTFFLDLDFDGELDDATLVITSDAAGDVPEPATWGTMLLGFGLAGVVLRRRKDVTARA